MADHIGGAPQTSGPFPWTPASTLTAHIRKSEHEVSVARPRLPQAKAEVSGSAIKDPGRFKARSVPKGTRAIGQPYAKMSADQKEAWADFADELPWLNSSHRPLLRIACILRVRMDEDDVGVNQIQTYSAILSKLGATPVDETKVSVPDGEEEDPADKFFGRPN